VAAEGPVETAVAVVAGDCDEELAPLGQLDERRPDHDDLPVGLKREGADVVVAREARDRLATGAEARVELAAREVPCDEPLATAAVEERGSGDDDPAVRLDGDVRRARRRYALPAEV